LKRIAFMGSAAPLWCAVLVLLVAPRAPVIGAEPAAQLPPEAAGSGALHLLSVILSSDLAATAIAETDDDASPSRPGRGRGRPPDLPPDHRGGPNPPGHGGGPPPGNGGDDPPGQGDLDPPGHGGDGPPGRTGDPPGQGGGSHPGDGKGGSGAGPGASDPPGKDKGNGQGNGSGPPGEPGAKGGRGH